MTLGLRAVIALIFAAAGLVVGGVLLGRSFETPDEAALRQPPQAVAVTDPIRSEMLIRSVIVRGAVAPARRDAPRFAAGLEGKIVTAIRARVGGRLASGQAALEVEGRPIIVLTGAFPTWRDFTRSMSRGRDVSQLQTALAELGLYRSKIDGRFGPLTLRAVNRLYRSIGYAPPSDSVLRHQELLFVPADMRTIDRVDLVVGDPLLASSIALASTARRIEADLTIDQQTAVREGLTIRVVSSATDHWSAAIDRIIPIERDDGAGGPNTAILTSAPVPPTLSGDGAFEIVLESTSGHVLSASPAAVRLGTDGSPFVVVLTAGMERAVPIQVGLVTASRAEITPTVPGALQARDELVLVPDR